MTRMEWEPVIGLEMHVQLATASKLFCGCANSFGGDENARVCPVCLGYPGTLPVLNERAVEQATRLSLALGAEVRLQSVFARKNYFYPDLPKGYQISQYDRPLAEWGALPLSDGSTLTITRLHLEEDAGKLLHEMPGGGALPGRSLVDYNRCGVPLVEIVTEPELHSAEMAQEALQRLHQVLRFTGTSDGNMEEGSLRCDVNISLRRPGASELGSKVEVKNINSFRNVARAIEHEIERQALRLEHGESVDQETRSFEANSGTTSSLRSKEEAHDYRYFPEPDLPALVLAEETVDRLRADLPESPWSREARFRREHALDGRTAALLSSTVDLAEYFEQTVQRYGGAPETVANWIQTEVLRRLKSEPGPRSEWLDPERLAALIELVDSGELSGAAAKDVFEEIWSSGESPRAAMERLNLGQIRDTDQLDTWVGEALAENPEPAAQLRAGEAKVIAFLIGQVMRRSSGRADPQQVRNALQSWAEGEP